MPIRTTLPDTVDVTLTRNAAGALILHLVNCPADLSRPVEHVMPVTGAAVQVRLQDGVSFCARALVADAGLAYHVDHGIAEIALPTLHEYEVVVIGQEA